MTWRSISVSYTHLDHGAAVWIMRAKGAHTKTGGRRAGNLSILYFPPGKTNNRTAEKGSGAGGITRPHDAPEKTAVKKKIGQRLSLIHI